MKYLSLVLLSLAILVGCDKGPDVKPAVRFTFPSSITEAIVSLRFDYKESDLPHMAALAYYTYTHKDEAIKSLQVVDSMRVENLWLVFYKYSINGRDYQHADWFLNIKGKYFYAGLYISEYNASDNFESENVDVVKALVKKADAWEAKSEKRWWKYLD